MKSIREKYIRPRLAGTKNVNLNLRISNEEKEWVDNLAKNYEMSKTDMILTAIYYYQQFQEDDPRIKKHLYKSVNEIPDEELGNFLDKIFTISEKRRDLLKEIKTVKGTLDLVDAVSLWYINEIKEVLENILIIK